MDINDALEMLQENNGEYHVPINVPSLNKEIYFKPLTVGKLKTISKMLLDGDDNVDMFIILVSIMLDLSPEEIDPATITEIDLIRVLLGLRHHNHVSENVYKLGCRSDKCDYTVNYKVELPPIFPKFDNLPDIIHETFKHEDLKIDIEFGLPNLNLIIKYKKFIDLTKKSILSKKDSFSDDDILKIEFYLVKYSVLLYIKNVTINDRPIENWNEQSIKQRNLLIDGFPPSILEYIKTNITGKKLYDIPLVVDTVLTCPKCKKPIPFVMDIESFFLV